MDQGRRRSRWLIRFTLILSVVALVACDESEIAEPRASISSPEKSSSEHRDDERHSSEDEARVKRFYPKSDRARRGVPYDFKLSSCDVTGFVDFNRSFWEATEDLDEAGFKTRTIPATFEGRMTLRSKNRAVFDMGEKTLGFRRLRGPVEAYSRSCY